jgi:hypothetical protein
MSISSSHDISCGISKQIGFNADGFHIAWQPNPKGFCVPTWSRGETG